MSDDQKTNNIKWLGLSVLSLIAVLCISYLILFPENTDPRVGVRSDPTPVPPKELLEVRVYQPEKTLWDWLQLMLVPVVLVGLGSWFTITENRRQELIETERTQDASLQNYFAELRSLILEQDLLKENPGDPEKVKVSMNIARSITITTLRQVSGRRKAEIITFLYEADLIRTNSKYVISLAGADLSHIELAGLDLKDIDLADTRLICANMRGCKLRNASLTNAKAERANLENCDLSNSVLINTNFLDAEFRGATIEKSELRGAILLRARNLRTKQLRSANRLFSALMANGSKYDGRYSLPGDVQDATQTLAALLTSQP